MRVSLQVIEHQDCLASHGRQIERILHHDDDVDVPGVRLLGDERSKHDEAVNLPSRVGKLVDSLKATRDDAPLGRSPAKSFERFPQGCRVDSLRQVALVVELGNCHDEVPQERGSDEPTTVPATTAPGSPNTPSRVGVHPLQVVASLLHFVPGLTWAVQLNSDCVQNVAPDDSPLVVRQQKLSRKHSSQESQFKVDGRRRGLIASEALKFINRQIRQ